MAFDQEPIEPSVNMLLNPPYVQQTASFLPTLATIFPSLPYQNGFPVSGTCTPNGFGLCWFPQPYSITARDPNTRTSYVYQYHVGVEEQLGQKAVFELAYVGSGGRKLPDNRLLLECTQSVFLDLNKQIGCVPPVIQGFPGLGDFTDSVVFQENHANSNFNSLQARLDTRAFHHFTFHTQYQWSHSIDNASSPVAPVFLLSPASAGLLSYVFNLANLPSIAADQLAVANNVNPALSLRPGLPTITTGDLLPNDTTNNANLSGERGNSNFDVRHRFVASYVFDVPSWSRAGRVLNGWQLAGITVVQSGQPFSVYGDFFGAPLRPSEVATPQINNSNPNGAIDNAIPAGCGVSFPVNPQNQSMVLPCPGAPNSSFSTTSIGVFGGGSLGRNTFYGPNLVNFDFSVLKNTYVSEGKNIQFQAEFFNLFNRANFLQPISQLGQFANDTVVSNPFFGQILQAQSPRQIQFALKFVF